MNSNQKNWLLSLLAVFLLCPVFSLGEEEVIITGEDEKWSAQSQGIEPLADGDFELPADEAIICHADEVWTGQTSSPDNMLLDAAFGGLFDLPLEAVICHADETFANNLAFKIEPESEPKDVFVYVALGDSYQAGEGAGNSILGTQEYLATAYEIGTYTDTLVSNNDGCHRSLLNYAKINRDILEPNAEVILIDKTCSGAKIETGDRPAIVGDVGSDQMAPDSQIAQAIKELEAQNLSVEDVDLITVGMGGNDARFAEIVQACVVPGLIKEALNQYLGSPKWVERDLALYLGKTGSCEQIIEESGIASDQAIAELVGKEIWAQYKILKTFPHAQVMQLNYPDILPEQSEAPVWCGGINKDDLDYANKKAKKINQKITEAINNVAALNPRLRLINIERALGSNALCPVTESASLANGIGLDLYDQEIKRLLNIDGNGDANSKELADIVFDRYNNLKLCIAVNLGRVQSCDVVAAKNKLMAAIDALGDYLLEPNQFKLTMANLVEANAGEQKEIKYDRSQGLFHPNVKGYEIIACNVLAAYKGEPAGSCLKQPSTLFTCTASGEEVGNAPIETEPGKELWLRFNGFEPNAFVKSSMRSTPIDLGTFIADSNGMVDINILLPEAGPGMHTISLKGNTAAGVGITQEVRVNYPGQPTGEGSYAVYLTGFTPSNENEEDELVDIIYAGMTFGPLTPDEDGGILVEVPLFGQAGLVTIQAKSQLTGKTVEETIQVIDAIAPEITIESPLPSDLKTYLNTDGILPTIYSIIDNSGENIKGRILLDGKEYTGNSINLGEFLTGGTHTLVVEAQDPSGNIARKEVIFRVEPKSLRAFSIKNSMIKWQKLPIKSKSKIQSGDFILSGEFEFPEGYKKSDLAKTVILSLATQNSTSTVELELDQNNNIWKYRSDDKQKQEIKINNLIVHWAPSNDFCSKNKICQKTLKNKNWFYIRGELSGNFTNATEAKIGVSLNFPMVPSGAGGSLYGFEEINFSKIGNLWKLMPLLTESEWKTNWWKNWDDYLW